MKYLFLFLLSGCIKDLPCNSKLKLPIGISIENNSSVSYIDVKIGNELVEPFTCQIWHSDQSLSKVYTDTIDLNDHFSNMPQTRIAYRRFDIHCLDGSYKIKRDTVRVKIEIYERNTVAIGEIFVS